MTTTDSELTIKAREVAKHLTYNEDKPQAEAKQLLLEMAHRIDTKSIRAWKNRDGVIVRNGVGKERYMTLMERLRWSLFGILPERV